MKIINLSIADSAGSAYCLSHAINKICKGKHEAINLRQGNNYFNYPTMAEMRHYTPESCRKMVAKSDVIVFHSTVKPYLEALNLDSNLLANKKTLVYFHGTELRMLGSALLKQVDENLENAQVLVSTPDLLFHAPKAKWLPVTRSFSEITRKYGMCNQDCGALESFGVPKANVVFTHAPSSEEKKGSATFYRVITRIIKDLPHVNYLTIRNQPWHAALQLISQAGVYFDQDPPWVPAAYGMAAVEASIFKIPIVTKLQFPIIQKIKELTGRNSPFIVFENEDDLYVKAFRLADDEKLRNMFGQLAYRYCKAVHDEKPVVERFLKIIEEMD